MDIVRSFTYIWEDDDWVTKLLILFVVNLIPIVNFATFGWTVDLVRNMLDGELTPLPGWDDFGDKFIAGLMFFIAGVIYNLPFICLITVLSVGIAGVASNDEAGLMIACLSCSLVCLAFVYQIAVGVLLFVGMVRYARERDFSAFLQFSQNMQIARDNLATLVMYLLFAILAGFVIGILALIPCLGWIAAMVLAPPVYGHLAGQAAVQMVGKRKVDNGYAY